jgi:hypothetical protein
MDGMTAPRLPEHVSRLAQIQRGILTTGQLRSGGVSRDVLRSRVRSGHWQQLHRSVYATFTGEPSREATLWACVLRAGRGAILSYYTAAELYGLIDWRGTQVHITIPESRRIMPIRGVVLHVEGRAERAAHPTQLPPRTKVEETVLDLTQVAGSAEDACAWIARGLGRRITTQAKLRSALDGRRRVRFRAEIAQMLSPDWAGIHSALEWRYVKWVEEPHGLPSGRRQVRVARDGRSEYRDVLYDEYALCVELDGRAAHPGDTRWDDVRRDNAAAAQGVMTLRYGWDDLRSRACEVADQVYRALSRTGPVRARPCSPGCPVGRNR